MKRILAVDDEPDLPEIATAEVCLREGTTWRCWRREPEKGLTDSEQLVHPRPAVAASNTAL